MEYLRFNPLACNFPIPNVSVLPKFGLLTCGSGKLEGYRAVSETDFLCHFTRARYALSLAYRLADISVTTTLLAPAYHCRTMLDPAVRLGGNILLYKLNPDLSPNLEDLNRCIKQCGTPVRSMLLTHYFGFPQQLKPISDFCKQNEITLIEDCSHTFFDATITKSQDSLSVGKAGKFGVASPYKFFPIEDGGLFWMNRSKLQSINIARPQSFSNEFKGIARLLQHAFLSMQQRSTTRASLPFSSQHKGCDVLESSDLPSINYQVDQENIQSLRSSRWIMQHTNTSRLINQRRIHYLQWLRSVEDCPNCSPLFPDLPAGCVPYMFPLIIDNPNEHFYELKRRGMPVGRWDDMAMSSCQVAGSYRLRLLHLPCHQELKASELAWMTNTVKSILKQKAAH